MKNQIEPVILFVSHKYPPATGGMEKQSLELITGMQHHASTYKIVYEGKNSILLFFRTLNRRILQQLREHPEINTIHFNDGLIASLALRHTGYEHLRKVVTIHGLDVVFPWAYFQRRILPRFNRFDKIIAVSHATADAIIARGVKPEKVTVIVNGIDEHLAALPETTTADQVFAKHNVPVNKIYLVLLGRPVRRKGFSRFIETILPQLPDSFHLLMIGPFRNRADRREKFLRLLPTKLSHLMMLFLGFPSDQRKIRGLLQDIRYKERITHLGKLPWAELAVVMQHAHAFLMPNIKVHGDMEGFGLVCLEASACGACVFAADLEGIKDAIQHQKNGILIPSENTAAWVEQLSDLSRMPEQYKASAAKYRLFTLANYSWNKMVREYLHVFKQC